MNPLVNRPQGEWAPVVASIPHGGLYVPHWIAGALLVELDRNYADWYTAELYSFLPELGIPSVASRVHRLVADANRRPREPLAAPWPKGVVATTSTLHEPMYASPPTDAEVAARLALAYSPYHEALETLVRESLERFPSIVLLDFHSFGWPLAIDVVVGDGGGTTASPRVADAVCTSFDDNGFTFRRNDPYTGGWIVRRIAAEFSIDSVMVELNQRIYLNPAEIDGEDWRQPPYETAFIAAAALRLRAVLATFLERLSSCLTPVGDRPDREE